MAIEAAKTLPFEHWKHFGLVSPTAETDEDSTDRLYSISQRAMAGAGMSTWILHNSG